MSRRHCAIRIDERGVTVEDLGSRNGTKLNGKPLPKGTISRIHHHDKLELGAWKFRISIRDAESGKPFPSPRESAGRSQRIQRNKSPDIDESVAQEQDSNLQTSAHEILKQLDSLTTELELEAAHRKPVINRDRWAERTSDDTDGASSDAESNLPSDIESARNTSESASLDSSSQQTADAQQAGRNELQQKPDGPQKLPEHLRPKGPDDSIDAAAQALRRLFGE